MNPITFKSYRGFGQEVTIIAERITHFYPIEYNGNRGTCIVLDTTKEVTVEDSPSVVRMAIEQAKAQS